MPNRIRETVNVDDLVIGSTSRLAMHDGAGRRVVDEGTRITVALVDGLRREGVAILHIDAGRDKSAPAAASRAAEPAAVATLEQPAIVDAPAAYPPERLQELQAKFAANEVIVDQLVDALLNGQLVRARDTEEQVDGHLDTLADDPDPVVATALMYKPDLTLSARCVQFSLLSMSIGLSQDLNERELRDLGSASMMHDWSLFSQDPLARFPHYQMEESVRQNYVRHPLLTESLLNNVQGCQPLTKHLVTQVHEFLDGSGFPRGLSMREIHPLAKILAVADAYLTLTSPPPGFARVLPSDAIAYLIAGASKGRYAPSAVTGLLHTVTLYPIGSLLELSDTTQVRVIRNNGKDFGYPIVQSTRDPDRIINLKDSELFITRPIPSPDYDETRLPDAYKELS